MSSYESDMESLRFLVLNTSDELFEYMHDLNKLDVVNPDFLNPLLNTKNFNVVKSMSESMELGQLIAKILAQAMELWDENTLFALLKVMSVIPFEYNILVNNKLGFKLIELKKLSVAKENIEMQKEVKCLEQKWRQIAKLSTGASEKKETLPTTQKRLSLDEGKPFPIAQKRSSIDEGNSLPVAQKRSSIDLGKPPVEKKVKLGIAKEAPAQESSGTFRIINKKQRPIYYVDKLLETNNLISRETLPPRPKSDKPKKTVTFKENLCEVRYFHREPEEWQCFVEMDQYFTTPWYTPYKIDFSSCSFLAREQVYTPEVMEQKKRESTALSATYISNEYIPLTPSALPMVFDHSTGGSSPKIPTDLSLNPVDPRIKMILSQHMPTPFNNETSPFTHHVMKQSKVKAYKQPTHYNPAPMATPELQIRDTMDSMSIDDPYAMEADIHAAPQPQTSSPPPTPISFEAMLQNNPDILNSLKQLSNLAGGSSVAQPVIPPTFTTQQPSPKKKHENKAPKQQFKRSLKKIDERDTPSKSRRERKRKRQRNRDSSSYKDESNKRMILC